uniref:Uncharacterized protein n=1 Tax=Arundo donax TaxID=35708 RepID=A0A0A9C4P6_ARUDO
MGLLTWFNRLSQKLMIEPACAIQHILISVA